MGKSLNLLFLFGGSRSLGGLRLGHALLELVHATCRIDELLLTGIEGMANVTNAHNDRGLGGTGLDHVAARATDFRIHILRMNICFHKRPRNIAGTGDLTSAFFDR